MKKCSCIVLFLFVAIGFVFSSDKKSGQNNISSINCSPVTANNPQEICPGSSYSINGNTYTVEGIYVDTLLSALGCDSIVTTDLTVLINATPMDAVLSLTGDDTICYGSSIELNASSNGVVSIIDNLGNPYLPNTSISPIQTTIYYAFAQSLEGCNQLGEEDSIVITVNPIPIANFAYNEVCLGLVTDFRDSSYYNFINSGSWSWNFDDPATGVDNTSTLEDPSHLYSTAGEYSVTLDIEDANGCFNDTVLPISVNPIPVANFTADNVCAGLATTFNSSSTIETGAITTYSWDFNNDNITDNYSVAISYVFTIGDSYPVYLGVVSDKGCSKDTTMQIIVHPVPVADFSAAPQCEYDSINFNNLSTLSAGTFSNTWTFADGNTSTILSPSHIYSTEGNYAVKLDIVSDSGCTTTITKNIVVYSKPIAEFTTNNICEYETAQFASISTNNDTSITMYEWSYDTTNVAFTEGQNTISLNYAFGTYIVGLIVTTGHNCKDSIYQNIIVHPKPVATITPTDTVCLGQGACFTNLSSMPVGTSDVISTYSWDFNQDNTTDISTKDVCNTYTAAGEKTIRLIIATNNQCTDTATIKKTINPLPIPQFTVSNVYLGAATIFNNQSNAIPHIASYTWDFGDGSAVNNDSEPSYIYPAIGTYTVNLRVVSDSGCVDTLNKTTSVINEPEGINSPVKENFDVSIFPNPSSQNINLIVHMRKKDRVEITLTNIVGQKIDASIKSDLSQGSHSFVIDRSKNNLPNGVYFVTVRTGNESRTERLILE